MSFVAVGVVGSAVDALVAMAAAMAGGVEAWTAVVETSGGRGMPLVVVEAADSGFEALVSRAAATAGGLTEEGAMGMTSSSSHCCGAIVFGIVGVAVINDIAAAVAVVMVELFCPVTAPLAKAGKASEVVEMAMGAAVAAAAATLLARFLMVVSLRGVVGDKPSPLVPQLKSPLSLSWLLPRNPAGDHVAGFLELGGQAVALSDQR